MPTSSSLVTNLPADFNTFGQAVDTSMSELLGGTTGQVLSKTSNTSMDFTWVTPADQTPLTTKGDIFAFSTVDARLPAGTNETRLVADSAQTLGLKYVADTTNYAIAAKGDLLVGTAADTLDALSVGTNDQILVADSTASTGLKWATPATPTSGMTLIKRATTTGAANTGTTYDGVFTSTYKAYKIVIESWISATAADDPLFQLRYAGPTTQSTDYYGANAVLGRDNVVINNPTVNGSALIMSENVGDSWGSHYEMTVTQVGNASEKPSGFYLGNRQANQSVITGALYNDVARTYTGFILSTASNLTVTVAVYGLASA